MQVTVGQAIRATLTAVHAPGKWQGLKLAEGRCQEWGVDCGAEMPHVMAPSSAGPRDTQTLACHSAFLPPGEGHSFLPVTLTCALWCPPTRRGWPWWGVQADSVTKVFNI